MCRGFLRNLIRRKHIRPDDLKKTDLARVLTTLDLTALGIGSTLGAGAYVIAGTVAKKEAGPAVIISFLIAAVASILAGLCYAEFGARVPKTGSAYIYTYVTVGEFLAFIVGWNLILEYTIGTSSVARTFSGYFDDLVGHKILPFFNSTMPMHVPTLAPYVDLFAFGITLIVTVILALGVKESVLLTKLFTALNLLVLSYIILCGAFIEDSKNWNLPLCTKNSTAPKDSCVPNADVHSCASKPETKLDDGCCENTAGCGTGGFSPYGFNGIISGAATCFFAFVGFDAIATTGEETKNPEKAIPVSIILSLLVVFLFYSGISVTITMMAPYFKLNSLAPFAVLFEEAGWHVSKYLITIGAICALCTSLLGSMFPMPRVVLAMARDGVIFRFFSNVSERFKTPVLATFFTGTLAGIMAAIFDVKSLVDMMSIGTLMAYTLVAACVLLLRYEMGPEDEKKLLKTTKLYYTTLKYDVGSDDMVALKADSEGYGSIEKRWVGGPKSVGERIKTLLRPKSISGTATPFSARSVKISTFFMVMFITVFGSLMTFYPRQIFIHRTPIFMSFVALSVLGVCICLAVISIQPQSTQKLPFTVPFVPYFPAVSIFFNIYLMLNLNYMTWARFGFWMLFGFAVYFGYGIRNSSESTNYQEKYKMFSETASDSSSNAGYANGDALSNGSTGSNSSS